MSNDQKPEPKQYSLTVHEANMLRFVNNHQNAIFSGLLSTIAGSRLGYTVTERTQFNLSGDFSTMTLMELDIPEQAKTAEAPKADDGGSPVVTAPETKEAQDASQPVQADTAEASQPQEPTSTEVQQDTSGGEAVGATEPTVPSEPQPSDSGTASDSAGQLAPAEAQPEPQAPTQAS